MSTTTSEAAAARIPRQARPGADERHCRVPSLDALTPDLAALALRTVTVAEPVDLSVSTDECLRLLRVLRDATSHAVRVSWTLSGPPALPERTHTHLIPPQSGTGEAARRYADRWASAYRYGAFYYRLGPGFVAIKDVRDDADAARMVIDEGSEAFLALAEAATRAEVEHLDAEVLETAAEAGLLLYTDDRILILPYRMRHWPVPYASI